MVGFNVDTLYSLANLDLSKEPLILSVPDMGTVLGDADHRRLEQRAACSGLAHRRRQGRTLRDRWPDMEGHAAEGVTELRVPTNLALDRGRTYTGGPDDYAAVHALQDQYKLVPLSSWGKDYTPPDNVPLKEGVDAKTPVPKQVLALSPEDFFNRSIACW